ncbi:MAG: hypothetical protein A2383_04030 [Candidatus Pacebacteria bacterium RIFOXYB1_FULL_39_46]|nr:MAG: hypothetical protein A2182_04285 [Candidatus Pacebacteria bacterium RIFOXYA1_FULL_38_18]OGJ38577.1 MAG: hypothetical protein A2383_04030 [Candidatus Pacebacteria bacterium RIFOXYB1_FULL_39_46]OGJ40437.1 MAG: hypothetical protein A2411_04170 [Candidatus Pacebacteria bacterium RIFOXYC1_FULL_39_21]OGJ40556.1 MAG: hypothetical protein A2582_02915 [Candidatus Pacebacteria bacterium RIFOXYD1_FULL_39_27]
MSTKKPLSQKQIIRKINRQTRKSYKFCYELLSLRLPVSKLYDNNPVISQGVVYGGVEKVLIIQDNTNFDR